MVKVRIMSPKGKSELIDVNNNITCAQMQTLLAKRYNVSEGYISVSFDLKPGQLLNENTYIRLMYLDTGNNCCLIL